MPEDPKENMNPTIQDTIVLIVPPGHSHYVVPPIGLGYLASSLRHHGFSKIHIIDCLKENFSSSQLIHQLKALNPAIIGFQVFSSDYTSVMQCIKEIKNQNFPAALIAGGPHVTATQGDILQEAKIDFAFIGEAEPGLPLLLKKIIHQDTISFSDIPGLAYRESGKTICNQRAPIPNLDELTIPAWDLIPPATYPDRPQGAFYQRRPIAPISTSRGCPYPCTFCASGVNMGSKLRLRSIPKVLDEMEILIRNYSVKEFHIIDDMFNYNPKRVHEFCQGIIERKLDIGYTFPNGLRLNQLSRDMLKEMKHTGAYSFTVGIESGCQRTLNRMKKKLDLKLIEEKVQLLNESGLQPSGFFIIGFPGETEDDIKETIRFAKSLKLKRAHFSNFLPLPGTAETARLLETGELKKPDWSQMHYSSVPYTPKGITPQQLKKLQRKAFLEFHLRPGIIFASLKEIKSWDHFKSLCIRVRDYLFTM
ncbi:MAG: B12-binding domain-containing radical SAM protein [Fibrobacteria bacterium]|nr:B12-binding domain-containing radical SAM protein [Fibrobacteria bacterium]